MRRTLSLVVLLCTAAMCPAIFLAPDLEKVPVTRLTQNLEKLVEKEPKNVDNVINLARTYAMAYAIKSSELEVEKQAPNRPWFGFTPVEVPFAKQVKKTTDKEAAALASNMLEKAIAAYEKALKLDPENMTARIGLAWATQEAGKKEDAIKQYRKLIDDAWAKTDSKLQFLGITGETITTEAGGYLIALLDPKNDAKEISSIKEKIDQLRKLPRPITPILIPLENGLTLPELVAPQARVRFDADGTGTAREWSWITPKSAWLVYDPKQSGKVTSGLQLFGNVTFRLFWSHGYAALTSLDDNADGELTDKELTGLALWQDKNSNGISDPGEVQPLASYNIVGLKCRGAQKDGIFQNAEGVRFANGSTRPTYDVILQSR